MYPWESWRQDWRKETSISSAIVSGVSSADSSLLKASFDDVIGDVGDAGCCCCENNVEVWKLPVWK